MIFLKLNSSFNSFPTNTVNRDNNNFTIINSAPFKIDIVAQKQYNLPTELLAVCQNDTEFQDWYEKLNSEDKMQITPLDRNTFDIFSDSYIPICQIKDKNQTSYRTIQNYINYL